MSCVIMTCTGSGKIGPEMIKFAFSSCFFMLRSLLLFVNGVHRRTNPRISQPCRTSLSGLRKDTKLYLILSLDYLIDFSGLRHITASEPICNVFSFPCLQHLVRIDIHIHGPEHLLALILSDARVQQRHRRAPPGRAWRATRHSLKDSGGSARCCYVAGCALGSRP